MPSRPLKLSEMARRLGVPILWLRAEAEAGRVPHLRTGSGMLFDSETIERILSDRARQEGMSDARRHQRTGSTRARGIPRAQTDRGAAGI